MSIRKSFVAFLGVVLMIPGMAMAAMADTAHSYNLLACAQQATAPAPVAPDKLKPFLKLPFQEEDGHGSLGITNGWLMAQDEIPIAGSDPHRALDFEFLRSPDHGYDKKVLASATGRARASYQYVSGSWTDVNGTAHQVGLGGGLFVEITHCNGWVTQYIHLSRVADSIPFLTPDLALDETTGQMTDWTPTPIYTLTSQELWTASVPVRQGQVIGWQGDSGIGLDWKDNFDAQTGKVAPRDRVALPPWDPTQLHFQLYGGRIDGAKQNITDPSGLDAQITATSNPYSPRPGCVMTSADGKWLTDRHGKPLYALAG